MADALIVIAGSSGLIGSALVTALRASDNRVVRIVRRAPSNATNCTGTRRPASSTPTRCAGWTPW